MTEILMADRPADILEKMKRSSELDDFVELRNLIGVTQSPLYHPEGDVWNHTMMVLNVAAVLKKEAQNPFGFMLVALTHDFGKAFTTKVSKSGKISAIGHDKEGVPIVERLLERILDKETFEEVGPYVLNMVKLHMRPNNMAPACRKQSKWNKLFSESLCPEDLLLFAKADHLGRAEAEPYDEIETILRGWLAGYTE